MLKLTSQAARTTINVAPEHVVGLVPTSQGTEVITVSGWSPRVYETREEILAMPGMLRNQPVVVTGAPGDLSGAMFLQPCGAYHSAASHCPICEQREKRYVD